MRFISLLVLVTFALIYCGCCRAVPPQPERPASVEGWNDSASPSTFRFRAVLLLHEGESSSNGKLGVRVKSILEAQTCGDGFSESHRRATVEFFDAVNGQIFCEELVADKGNSRISCADKVGADVIGVRAISTAEKWILFDLHY